MITLEEINAQIGRSVIINVNKTYNNISLYEATKKCWRMNIDRAQQAEYVISEYRGEIVGVFKPESWSVCEKYPDRISFKGEDVTEDYHYLCGRQIPKEKGSQNPIRYSYLL